ncbi:MAG: type II toxin-antitoxin system prevent-host-death family antitoxin [Gemmatimonadetes bacterium]|nr:type II toxin-antitoxin system prevent-host-death family antitoxin [Gemmatimonadota bacterium]
MGRVRKTYSTYEAKAKLSEILRRVRDGEVVVVSHRGEPIAEIRPISREGEDGLRQRLSRLEARGVLVRGGGSRQGKLHAIARRPGALRRFLRERDT